MPSDWRMSSYSNPSGNCVECKGDWKKSSYSADTANCVEVARPAEVLVRDSKNRGAGHLTFTPAAWAAFVGDIKNGLDRPKT